MALRRASEVPLVASAIGKTLTIDVVDLLAVRKDHGPPMAGMRRGDNFQLILIQIKGGAAAMPTRDDAKRLRAVARRHRARHVLLASCRKGSAVRFFRLHPRPSAQEWVEVTELEKVFA